MDFDYELIMELVPKISRREFSVLALQIGDDPRHKQMQNLEKLTFEANPKEFPLVYSQKTRKQTQGHSKIKQSKTKPTNTRTRIRKQSIMNNKWQKKTELKL